MRSDPIAKQPRILIIDDDQAILETMELILTLEGYEVLKVERGELAIEILKREQIDLVITDLKMPGMSGLEVIAELKRINPSSRVLIASGFVSPEVARNHRGIGALGYIRKPFSLDELTSRVHQALMA